MIYKIFWFWANIAIRVFYGKIEVSGLDNIPTTGPLLIASNHPNGFLEPIIMACLFKRPMHFMVRGDVFKKAWLKPMLVNTNQIPIFRFKDGFKALRKNDSNLQEAYKALDQDAAIILFIEGGTKPVKKLRPFQKGLARMACSYIEKYEYKKDINVLPVAINFVSPFSLRSRVCLNVGHAFGAKQYFQDPASKVKDMVRLTNDVYDKVLPLAFNVQNEKRQSTLDHALQLAEGLYKLPFFPFVTHKSYIWPSLKLISERINEMPDAEFDDFEKEVTSIRASNPYQVKRTGKGFWSSLFWVVVSFVFAMVGLLLNIIPGMIAKMLPSKVLSKDKSVFVASIILSSGVGFYVVYYALCILILSFFFGWKSILFLFAWPLGFVYLFWKNNYRSSIARSQYHLTAQEKEKIESTFLKYNIKLTKI